MPKIFPIPSKTEKVYEMYDTSKKSEKQVLIWLERGAPRCHHARTRRLLCLIINRCITQNLPLPLPPTLRRTCRRGPGLPYSLQLLPSDEGLKSFLHNCLIGLRCRGPIYPLQGPGRCRNWNLFSKKWIWPVSLFDLFFFDVKQCRIVCCHGTLQCVCVCVWMCVCVWKGNSHARKGTPSNFRANFRV